MTPAEALKKARVHWPSTVSVEPYTRPEWRCSGWRGWRVTLLAAGGVIHWMTRKGGPQCRCCRADTKREPNKYANRDSTESVPKHAAHRGKEHTT
jgi:hypothetical protein